MAAVMVLGFQAALELAVRHYGLSGPITLMTRELVFPPKSGGLLYGGMALMMVVLTWRQRFIALSTAIGIDAVFWVVRYVAGAEVPQGQPFGSGALWVILGWGVYAVAFRTGRDRVLLLKGVGLALLLVAGRKAGDAWLFLTARSRPVVLDQYVATADHALGNPSWILGRIVTALGPVGFNFLDFIYGQLAIAAILVALFQLRHVAATGSFPRHHLLRTFLVIGLIGPVFYMIFPVVGPVFAFGTGAEHWESISLWAPHMAPSAQWAVADVWPNSLPSIGAPQHMTFDEFTPRNCMPSLHTAWATAIFIHTRKGPAALRHAGTFWLVGTLAATLGFGYHYGADIIAGVVFTLTIEAGLRAYDRGWDRSGIRLVVGGAAVFGALLLSYRYLPVHMAQYPLLFGPVLLSAMLAVIYAYVRTTSAWEPATISAPRPAPAVGL
ncbi:DUF5933 domain-containing protein [Streptomyces sp. NPDC001139]